MINYCPRCGKRITDSSANFCSTCGTRLNRSTYTTQESELKRNDTDYFPRAADTIISLNDIAGVFCIIFGIFFLLIGLVTLIVFIGIFFIAFAVINFLIKSKLTEINRLIKQKRYGEARNEHLSWMILGFILGGIIIGIILLIGYLKYEELPYK